MKRIISLLLALALIIGATVSMSSCAFYFYGPDDMMDGMMNPEILEGGIQNGGIQNGGINVNGGSGSSGGSGGPADFYPDSDGVDITGLSPESRALLSTVAIVANFQVYSYGLGGYDYGTSEQIGYGSGVIYSLDKSKGDAYIITNYHVVHNSSSITDNEISDDIEVYLYGQESDKYKIVASYLGGSLVQDLAVLKISGSEVIKNSLAVAVNVGDSDKLSVMDEVMAVGNPEGYGISVTPGVVSVDSETLSMTGSDGRTPLSLRVIRTSAAINNGNSGGGLYSADGKLVGIVNAKRTGEDIDNIGYAIPINLARNIADNIIYYCNGQTSTSLKKCQLGITLEATVMGLVTDEAGENLVKVEYVAVKTLESNCVMSDVKAGDVITAITIDGVKYEVTRIHHVIDNMLRARVGSTVELELKRGGETVNVSTTIPESSLVTVK